MPTLDRDGRVGKNELPCNHCNIDPSYMWKYLFNVYLYIGCSHIYNTLAARNPIKSQISQPRLVSNGWKSKQQLEVSCKRKNKVRYFGVCKVMTADLHHVNVKKYSSGFWHHKSFYPRLGDSGIFVQTTQICKDE